MITRLEHLVSIDHYAKLCGVTRRNIADRIKSGTVSHLQIHSEYIIDKQKSPPEKRQKIRSKRSAPKPSVPAAFIIGKMITVRYFARRRNIRADYLFECIITERLNAFVVSELVFVNADHAEAILKNK